MGDPADVFFDTYSLGINEFGANLRLAVSMPGLGGQPSSLRDLLTLRMAPQTMKLLAYQLVKAVAINERERGITFPLSAKTLNASTTSGGFAIGLEDWEEFWGRVRGPESQQP